MSSDEDNNKTYGVGHWLYQVIPPLLMLCILFTTEKGTALVFYVGFLLIPTFISVVSIFIKLFNLGKKKYYLLRPLLTILFFILILAISQWSYKMALNQAIEAAKIIHEECNANLVCPENPKGWVNDDSRIMKQDLGLWLKYLASYYYDKNTFEIRVYQGPDLGDVITGGINSPFNVERYRENTN